MRYVLDTNAVSALMRGDAGVIARLRAIPRADVAMPQPVLAELRFGVERLPAGKRRERLRERLAQIASEIPRVPWNDDVSAQFGRIKTELERRGTPLEDFDVAIAAHAHVLGAVLVTHDRALGARVSGVTVEDWAESAS